MSSGGPWAYDENICLLFGQTFCLVFHHSFQIKEMNMNSAEVNKPAGQEGIPMWSERDQHLKVQRWVRIIIFAVVAMWLALISWVFFIAKIDDATFPAPQAGANLTLVLAPVLVAAAAV